MAFQDVIVNTRGKISSIPVTALVIRLFKNLLSLAVEDNHLVGKVDLGEVKVRTIGFFSGWVKLPDIL